MHDQHAALAHAEPAELRGDLGGPEWPGHSAPDHPDSGGSSEATTAAMVVS